MQPRSARTPDPPFVTPKEERTQSVVRTKVTKRSARRSQSGSPPLPLLSFFLPRDCHSSFCADTRYTSDRSAVTGGETRPGFPALGSSAVCRPGRSSETAGPPVALPAPARGFRAGVRESLSPLSTLLRRRSVSLLLPRGLLPFPPPRLASPRLPRPSALQFCALYSRSFHQRWYTRCYSSRLLFRTSFRLSSLSSFFQPFTSTSTSTLAAAPCRSCVLRHDETRDHCSSSRKRGQISRSLHDVILSFPVYPLSGN